ncbi:STAS domain-containing protein [Nocardia sp. NPDC050710]|uniref:STAS domain-containing protein n=1 Tax=Nocardia sp. NPDC050710 TaxID=3157220 RepID=UPI0033DD16AC
MSVTSLSLLRSQVDGAHMNGSGPPRHYRMWAQRVARRRGRVVVHVEGELDATAQPEFHATLEHATRTRCHAVVVDLRAARFLSLRCAATLLAAHDNAACHGTDVRVVVGRPAVERALEVTGVRAQCGRYASIRAALDA